MSASFPDNVPLPPLSVNNPADRGGLIVLITTLLLAFVLLCFATRIYTRTYITGPSMRDDHVLTAATVVCCIQSILVYVQVSRGFGKSKSLLEDDDAVRIDEIGYAADLLYILGLTLSKFSVSFLFLRLSPDRGHARASWAAIAGSAIWAFMALLLRTIRCDPGRSWSYLSSQCGHLLLRWQLICAFDIITEAVLFSIVIYIVANLHTSLRAKAIVILVFGVRLPVIAASIVRLYHVKQTIYSGDPTLLGAYVAVWTQVELDYSIMIGTFSCLGPFMSPFSTSLQEKRSTYTTASVRRYTSNTYGIRSVASTSDRTDNSIGGAKKSAGNTTPIDERKLRPDLFSHKTTVSHDDIVNRPNTDSTQIIITKNMQRSVNVK